MAGNGPAPKLPEQRRHRAEPQRGEWVTLPRERREVPDLPPGEWHDRAAAAWSHWWSDPAATQWSDSQFDELVALLALSDEFWQGNRTRAAEMRLRMDGLGLTLKGKRDLRWRAPDDDEAAPPARPKAGAARRKRLQVVG
jgi:hypothetical protein